MAIRDRLYLLRDPTGDLVFEVTVTDNLGGKASDQVKVSVTR